MTYPVVSILAALLALMALATFAGRLLADAGFPLPPRDGRLGCIDGLRGYLALSVLAHHSVMWIQATRLGGGWDVPTVPFLNELGAGAVGLFFMVTGAVFYGRVLAGFRGTAWPALYVGRAFRILPLVAVSVAAVAAIAAHRSGQAVGPRDGPALLTWLSAMGEPPLAGDAHAAEINAGVLWTLRFEWLFYLMILPGLAVATDLIRGRLPSIALPTALLAMALVAGTTGLWVTLMRYLPHFAVGMLAADLRRHPAIAARLRGRPAGALAAAGLLLTMATMPFPVGLGLPAFGFFFLCVACGNDLFGVLRSRGALVLGELSFSLYLLHAIGLSLVFVEAGALLAPLRLAALPWLMLPLGLAAILVSCVTYARIERPAMRLGRRLAGESPRPSRPVSVVEAAP